MANLNNWYIIVNTHGGGRISKKEMKVGFLSLDPVNSNGGKIWKTKKSKMSRVKRTMKLSSMSKQARFIS